MLRDTRRTRVVLGVLLLVSFLLITLDLRGGEKSPVSAARGAALAVFSPIERGASAIVRPVTGAIRSGWPGSRNELTELRRENAELRRELRTTENQRHRAQQLDALLRIINLGHYRTIPAQVIAFGNAQGFSWTVTIDAGAQDGIEPDMTVINGDGLIGRVTTVAPAAATVLLAIDPTSSVGARLAGSAELGIATGQGSQPIKLQLLNGQADVQPGDQLVTFGSDGQRPFVPGVPLGEVASVARTPGALTRSALITPYVNFTALDLVGVVVPPVRKDPRDALLPAKAPIQPEQRS